MTDSLPPPNVLPGPHLSAAPPPRLQDIDTGLIIRDTLRANGELVGGLLRTISPTLEGPLDDGQVVGTYSTPAESAERTKRYRFSITAIVLICATIAAGIVLLAYNAHMVDSVAGVAGWLTLTGLLSASLVYRLQAQDFKHSAEGIAHAREGYRAVVDQTDADSRAELAKAYAYAIRRQADAQAHTVEAQAKALDAEVQRLMLATPAPQSRRLRAPAHDDGAVQEWHLDAEGNPQPGLSPVPPPVATPVCPPVPPGVDPVVATVLAWVASLYDDPATVHAESRRVLAEVPWSARSKALPEADKQRVKIAVLGLDPPLFEIAPGNGLVLKWRFKWSALQRVKEAL